MKNDLNQSKVPFISKLAYGMGDVGCNFSWMFVGNFLMIFYTDVFGISMSAVATLMLFSRFWDAINDPIIGGLSDKTHTRWGRYRPWLLFAASHTVAETQKFVENAIAASKGLRLEYFEIVDGNSLQKIANWEDTEYAVGCITVFCGEVRLIDNIKYKEKL